MIQPKYNTKEALERAKLLMKYDTSKTLTENELKFNKQLIQEQGELTLGQIGELANDINSNLVGNVESSDLDSIQNTLKNSVFGRVVINTDGTKICALSKLMEYWPKAKGPTWGGAFTSLQLLSWKKRSKDFIKDIENTSEVDEPEFEDLKKTLINSIRKELDTFCKTLSAPAPGTPAPGTPAPGTPAPGTPAPGTPAPGTPTPGTPTPGTPAPRRTSKYTDCSGQNDPTLWCKNNSIVSKVQGCLGIKVDGAFGPQTKGALEANGLSGSKITQDSVDKVCNQSQNPEVADENPEIEISGSNDSF